MQCFHHSVCCYHITTQSPQIAILYTSATFVTQLCSSGYYNALVYTVCKTLVLLCTLLHVCV